MKNFQYHPSIQKKQDGTFAVSVTTSQTDAEGQFHQGIDSHYADNLPSFEAAYSQMMSWFPNAVSSGGGIPGEWWHYHTVEPDAIYIESCDLIFLDPAGTPE